MIDALEVFLDVTLEYVPELPRILAVSVDCGMGALALSAGKGICDKGPVKERFYDVAQGMVNHPVAIWCGAYEPLLRIIHEEVTVTPMPVALFRELSLQSKELAFEIEIE